MYASNKNAASPCTRRSLRMPLPAGALRVCRRIAAVAATALAGYAGVALGAAAPAAHAAHAAHAVPDTIGQSVLACVVCHGEEGRATPDGYLPRIAGKPAGYLYNQLLNFRDGRRHNAAMSRMLAYLSDDYLREIAEYFASVDLPYPPPQAPAASPAALAHGQTLVRRGDAARQLPSCAACHGPELTGVEPAVPGLLGLPRDYLAGQFGAWKTGLRHAQAPDCMAEIAERMRPDDVAAVVNWLASQPVPADSRPAAEAPEPPPMRCGGVPQ